MKQLRDSFLKRVSFDIFSDNHGLYLLFWFATFVYTSPFYLLYLVKETLKVYLKQML